MSTETRENLIKLCENIAIDAHNGQFRNDRVTPYIVHPKAVAERVASLNKPESLIGAAWLHDVIEDTPMSGKDLQELGVPPRIVRLVEILSKRPGESYLDYLLNVAKDEDATIIKICDISHNLETSSGNQKDKWMLSRYILEEARRNGHLD